jgi:hypothetical protein
MTRLQRLRAAWRWRRPEAPSARHDLQRSARDVIGPLGNGFSNAWEEMAKGSEAYVKSFDRRVPPSIFVSERDRSRYGQPVPLVERRIGEPDDALTPEELDWASRPPGAD